ncbi:MAG: hypothetical protein RIG26_03180 [Thalassospira sp.]|uniref:hypothetical protein n=1 Tax=Thalassospira sp. TaxID=1912094 RepID=UPI0032EFE415
MAVKTQRPRRKKLQDRKEELGKTIFSELKESDLWHYKKNGGFFSVPRPISIILRIIDSLSTNKRCSTVYLDLCSRTYSDFFVEIEAIEPLAFASGYTGARRLYDWKERVKTLEELGFIKIKAGEFGDISYIAIVNPYVAITKLRKAGKKIPDDLYNALVARAHKIAAKDAATLD